MKLTYEKIRNIILTLILAGGAISIFYICSSPHESMGFDNEPCIELNEGWTYTNGSNQEQEVSLPVKLNADGQEEISIHNQLPSDLSGINTLCFRSTLQSVRVYLEEKCIYTFGVDASRRPFGKTSGNAWNMVRLPEHSEGKRITVTVSSPYKYPAGVFTQIYGGTKSSILFFLLKQQLGTLVIAGILFFVGLISLLLSFVYRKYLDDRSVLYLGWFALLIAVWLFGESRTAQFFIENQIVVAYVNYICLMLFPVPVLQYICSIKDYHYKDTLESFIWLLYMNAVVFALLQLFNYIDFYHSIFVTHFILFCAILTIIVTFVLEIKKYGNQTVRKIVFSFLILCVFFLAELISFYLSGGAYIGKISGIGVLLFTVSLCADSSKRSLLLIISGKELDLRRKVQTLDAMTQCKNRTAFIEDMGRITRERNITVVLMEVKNLKLINERFGYQHGDETILKVCSCMKKILCRDCVCYRTGGQEFAGILENWKVDDVRREIQNFIKACEEVNEATPYKVQIMVGYEIYDPGQDKHVLDTVRRVDKNRYSLKLDSQ